MKPSKILQKAKRSPENLNFGDMCKLVEAFGFTLDRIRGSHHLFVHPDVDELVNLQEESGKAKPYQVRQFLKLVAQYGLKLGDD